MRRDKTPVTEAMLRRAGMTRDELEHGLFSEEQEQILVHEWHRAYGSLLRDIEITSPGGDA